VVVGTRRDLLGGVQLGMVAETLSRRTVQKQLVLLHGILRRAKSLRWIRENPAEDVERVNVQRSGDFNVLSVAQVEAIAREAEPMLSAAIIVAAYTGLRTGELRAWRWRDVDFASATVHVRRNRPAGGDEAAPKSGKVRSVPLMDDAARALDDSHSASSSLPRMIGCSQTRRAKCSDRTRSETRCMRRWRQPESTASHSRRGTGSRSMTSAIRSTLAVQVFPLVDVQAYMGHADIQTTMQYAHHVPKHDAAQRFTEAINREKGAAQTVSPTVSRTAENSAQLAGSTRAEEHRAGPVATH
jgi:integrase